MTNVCKKITSVTLIVFLISGCSLIKKPGGFFGPREMLPLEVETIKIKPENKSKYLKAVGSLESPQTTELTSENMGKIIYLNIPEGKIVSKGNVIARLEDSTLQADVNIAKAKLKNAEEYFNRMKKLKDEGAVSQQTLDNAIERFESIKGEVESTLSKQTKSIIVAPFTGALSLKQVSLGAYIDPGDVVVRISQIDPLNLIFSFPEQYTSEIKVGQNVRFMVSNSEESYSGKVTVIDPYIDPDTRTVKVKAIVNNSDKVLLPGCFANVFLEVGSIQGAISVPQEALIQEGNVKKIALVTKTKTVKLKEVNVGLWEDNSVLITKGLMTGDIVITSGHQKVQEGSKVIPKPYVPIHNKQLDKEI